MKILISNDDGYLAPGIIALAEAMSSLADITVVAPDSNRSGASNALTLDRPLSVQRANNGFYFVNGTPSDCVHIALTAIMKEKPDLIVSGINQGQNMGDDTLYSGTVGAAMEGYLFGIPSIAFSLVDKGWAHIEDAALKARDFVQHLQTQDLLGTRPWLLNVNMPNRPYAQIREARLCRLGRRHAAEPVITQISPRGETMYWIGNAGPAMDDAEGTDFHAVREGWVAVTPLKVDLTEHEQLGHWSQSLSSFATSGGGA